MQIVQDITEECNKHGTVLRVLVPRPADASKAAEVGVVGLLRRAFD